MLWSAGSHESPQAARDVLHLGIVMGNDSNIVDAGDQGDVIRIHTVEFVVTKNRGFGRWIRLCSRQTNWGSIGLQLFLKF